MLSRSLISVRNVLLTLCLAGGSIATLGCSSKPAETDTAEIVPDPAVRPAPVAVPSPTPAVEVTPAATDQPSP